MDGSSQDFKKYFMFLWKKFISAITYSRFLNNWEQQNDVTEIAVQM